MSGWWLEQPEIFGRFVLLDVVDDDPVRPRTFRALDLDRELQPLVAVRRSGPWTEQPGPEALLPSEWHATMDVAGVAESIDRGFFDGWHWTARAWLPGISLDRVIADADATGRPLPLGLALSIAYILVSVVSDVLSSSSRPAGVILAPRPRRIIVGGDGRVRLFGPRGRESPTHPEEREFGPGRHDLQVLATTVERLCTAGGGEVPAELRRRLHRATQEVVPASELAQALRPLMEAAGGGSYSGVAAAVRDAFAPDFAADDARREKDLQLARRLRARRRKVQPASLQKETMRLRIRPASQEGPARLERVEDIPPGMVVVDGGRFLFSQGDDVGDYVDVKPFFVDSSPVTWSAWAAFCEQTGHPPPPSWPAALRSTPTPSLVPPGLERTPVTGIGHDDAEAYARFVGKRLLTEIEWELAARGFDGRTWAWGNDFDADKAGDRWRIATPEPATISDDDLAVHSPFGLSLLGHAWEWTSTPAGDLADPWWVVRGGPWRNRREPPTLLNRSRERNGADDVTFRCALDIRGDVVDIGELPTASPIHDVPRLAGDPAGKTVAPPPAAREAGDGVGDDGEASALPTGDTDEGEALPSEDDTDEEQAT